VAVPEPAALTDTYALIKLIHAHVPGLPIDAVINRVTAAAEGEDAFAKLQLAATRFLRRDLGGPTLLLDDPAIRDATRRPGALAGLTVPPLAHLAQQLDHAAAPASEAPCPR
jgi:MinD-like ATPase involved in chromosome partitioning or flagellar assembly